MGKKLQPKLRFKGFTDDWEPRRLGDVAEIGTGSHNTQDGHLAGAYPFFIRSDQKLFLDDFDYDEEAILIPGDGRIGQIYHYMNGKYALHQRVYRIKVDSSVDTRFILYLMESRFRKHALAMNSQGTVPSLRKPIFTEWGINLPRDRDEQVRIGMLFSQLDNLIAAEKRKLRLLQERKRSLLKGIFNRTIRFEGFTGVWKQQKLKDEAISISAGGDIDREKLLPSGRYPVIGNALSNNGIIGYYANDYEVKGPAVTVTGRGEVGVAKAREMNFTPVVRLLVIKSLHDSHFLECAINLHRAPLESTGVPQLTIPIISNYKLLFPPTLMEEMSIGLLFKHIDSLIAAVFLKIELLNLKKQSLLQQMFV